MKTLLVCTDFSEPAFHAAEYAVMLARNYKLNNITLFHAYQAIEPPTGLPVTTARDLIYKASMDQLKDLKDKLQSIIDRDTMVRIRTEDLSLSENINDICREENSDIVVMGITGKSKFEKIFVGSNTVNVSQKFVKTITSCKNYFTKAQPKSLSIDQTSLYYPCMNK